MPAQRPSPKGAARKERAESAKRSRAAAAYDEAPQLEMEESAAAGFADGYGGDADDAMVPAPPPGIELGASLLQYDELQLAGPDDHASRGKLRPRPAEAQAAFTLINHVNVSVNVMSVVVAAQRVAQTVDHLPLPSYAVAVREEAGSFDYRFDAEHPVDVSSDGKWRTVPVAKAPVRVSPEFVTVPSVDPKVFRTVLLRNDSPHALLAGPADVLLGEEFVMTVPFPTLAPGGERRVGIGVEESLKVSRNVRFDEATGGMFGGSTVLTHTVEIELANRLARPAPLLVRERVPLPADDDVKVDESAVTPAWSKEEHPQDPTPVAGARQWRVTVEPNAVTKLTAKWVVKIPASKMLNGGNRRA